MVGLVLIGGAALWADRHGDAREHAVVTTAVIEEVDVTIQERRGTAVLALVRYDVADHPVRTRLRLGTCRTAKCLDDMRNRKGSSVRIVYDSRSPERAKIAQGQSPPPMAIILPAIGLGLLGIGYGIYSLLAQPHP